MLTRLKLTAIRDQLDSPVSRSAGGVRPRRLPQVPLGDLKDAERLTHTGTPSAVEPSFNNEEAAMPRATISKRTLDQLIQAKLSGADECAEVTPMPVQWRRRKRSGCNWMLPGYIGEGSAVKACKVAMERYLDLLRDEFDVPEES